MGKEGSTVRAFTVDSAVLGLGSSGCDCTVHVFDRNVHSRMPLVPMQAC
jgi:hypothetical protein